MSEVARFFAEVAANASKLRADAKAQRLALELLEAMTVHRYGHNFTWLGRPIIQLPQDVMAIQEVLWSVRPDLVVETGVAHGGSLIFSASMLELIGGDGRVVGVDVEVRPHNRVEIEKHPMSKRIALVEGSSTDPRVVADVLRRAQGRERVVVILDSNHTHEHVLRELDLYSPLVKKGSYLIVLDTLIEDLPAALFPDRPWGKGNNPKSAVHAFLKTTDRFAIDEALEARLLLSVAPDGYLKCVRS